MQVDSAQVKHAIWQDVVYWAMQLYLGGGSTHSNAITVISAAVIVILTIIIIIGLMSIVMILKYI